MGLRFVLILLHAWQSHMPDDYTLDGAHDDPVDDEPDEDERYDQPDAYEDYGLIG